MKKVLICHDFPGEYISGFEQKFKDISIIMSNKEDEILKNIGYAEILIGFSFSRDMLEKADKLKWIQVLSAGVDHLPLDYIREKGIILTNGRGIHKTPMSEYAIWAMISLAINAQVMAKNQVNGVWDKQVPMDEIYGSTVGILGLGSIGQEIAKKASIMGMHVIGVKSNVSNVDYVDKVYSNEEISEVIRESDYLINLLPYTRKTDRIINAGYLNLMKKTACFINMGRGRTVNEEDLIQVLREKKIRAMVSDVFNDEPLPEDSPLWKMDNVIITPHISGVSPKYIERAIEITEHNLEAYLNNSEMMNLIDLENGY